MNSIVIKDTHRAVENLTKKGASKELAEEIVDVVQNAALASDPATQADIAAVRSDIANLRVELYKAMAVQGVATAGFTVALVKWVI